MGRRRPLYGGANSRRQSNGLKNQRFRIAKPSSPFPLSVVHEVNKSKVPAEMNRLTIASKRPFKGKNLSTTHVGGIHPNHTELIYLNRRTASLGSNNARLRPRPTSRLMAKSGFKILCFHSKLILGWLCEAVSLTLLLGRIKEKVSLPTPHTQRSSQSWTLSSLKYSIRTDIAINQATIRRESIQRRSIQNQRYQHRPMP